MFDFFNNRLFDLNRDGKVDIFEKAFVYHTLFEDDDKNVSRNDDYDIATMTITTMTIAMNVIAMTAMMIFTTSDFASHPE